MTKRSRKVGVVQVEFENDATVLCVPSAVLMNGSDPLVPMDHDGIIKCKDEPAEGVGDDLMETGTGVGNITSEILEIKFLDSWKLDSRTP